MGGIVPLAGAVLAVVALIAASWHLGFTSGPAPLDRSEAAHLANTVCGGFAAATSALDVVGMGALLMDNGGRIVVLAPAGAHYIARLAQPGWQVDSPAANTIAITAPDFASTVSLCENAGPWLAALGKVTARPA